MAHCLQCQAPFEISEKERTFIDEVSPIVTGKKYLLPNPKLCPPCRRQRRCAFRNDRKLYKRSCDKTGKTIVSIHHPEKPFPVYSQEVFWSDEHDPAAYGLDFDFSRPFFEQFADLQKVTPRVASSVVNSENCEFTAFTLQCRNCYLSSRLADNEDIYYTYLALKSTRCFDCYNVATCELNYQCVDNRQSYHCFFTERCRGSHDLMFCSDMSGSNDCFGCVGLVQKQFHFFNEKLSKEDYEKRVKEWWDGSQESVDHCLKSFREHQKKFPVRAVNVFNSENVFGTYVFESRNIYASFDIVNCEDAMHCTQSECSKDIMDTDMAYYGERAYEQISVGRSMNTLFGCTAMNGNSDLLYFFEAFNSSQNCFGCIGIKKKQYCILNKQYTKEEYEELLPRIIAHMEKTCEWGEFFPLSISSFGYNETVAMSLFPLSKEEVLQRGWNWYDEPEEKILAAEGENIVTCEVIGRPFKIVPQEKKFYEEMNLPWPRKHPDVRHKERLALRNPYRLREDRCKKCSVALMTDQSPDKIIYCEACYLAEIY